MKKNTTTLQHLFHIKIYFSSPHFAFKGILPMESLLHDGGTSTSTGDQSYRYCSHGESQRAFIITGKWTKLWITTDKWEMQNSKHKVILGGKVLLLRWWWNWGLYSGGQKSCNELKLRICLTLYKKCDIKRMFETEFEIYPTHFLTKTIRQNEEYIVYFKSKYFFWIPSLSEKIIWGNFCHSELLKVRL